MSPAERADRYLLLPADPAANPARLRWSADGDAIEEEGGRTFAPAGQVALLLSGVFSRPKVPPFPLVMALFHAMRDADSLGALGALGRAYAEASRPNPVNLTRNAGLLIAEACHGIPVGVAAPEWDAVSGALHRLRVRPDPLPAAPVVWSYCKEFAAARLRHLDHDALVHRLKFGAPAPAAPPAEALEPPPGCILSLLEVARRRPRLAGAALLAPAVEAAFALPPRRRRRDTLPQGGYADVATRGDPGRLLPSQFALDPDDFVRRYAAGELLYFQREEPHAPPPPGRVVVLDQGVRTWGSVRLALAGAALALVTGKGKSARPVTLYTTGSDAAIDPATADAADLADRLEASDWSPHPADALSRAISESGDLPRDLILLTHPRSVAESPVIEVARLRQLTDRAFSLSVDDAGRAELGEWTPDGWRSLRTFRLDLVAAEAAQAEGDAPPARPVADPAAWAGDVEPVPFPFRAGLVNEPEILGFDADGDWLVCAGRDGVPHGLAADGWPPEVLPRAFAGGAVLKTVDAIVGVADGVVICGRMAPQADPVARIVVISSGDPVARAGASDDLPATPPIVFVAAHYDRGARRVKLHTFGSASGGASWSAFPALNCVAVRPPQTQWGFAGGAVDLATGGRWPGAEGTALVARARAAWAESERGAPPHHLPVVAAPFDEPPAGEMKRPYLARGYGRAHLMRAESEWQSLTPQSDGKPMLQGATIEAAVLAGNTLALALSRPGDKRSLALFRGPDGAVAGEFAHAARNPPFALSPDGQRLARWRGRREVVVGDVAATGPPRVAGAPAHLHSALDVLLEAEPFRLGLRVGAFEHHFTLDGDSMVYGSRGDGRTAWTHSRISDFPPTGYDPARFPVREAAGSGRRRLILDRLGQVLLFGEKGALVAAFLVRRDRAAAWLPDGTFWGDAALIGGPPTPGAERKFGAALRASAP